MQVLCAVISSMRSVEKKLKKRCTSCTVDMQIPVKICLFSMKQNKVCLICCTDFIYSLILSILRKELQLIGRVKRFELSEVLCHTKGQLVMSMTNLSEILPTLSSE